MNRLALLYLVLAVLVLLGERALSLLNVRFAASRREPLPDPLPARFSADHLARTLQYLRTRTRFGHITTGISFLLTLVYLFSGLLPWLDQLAARLAWPALVTQVLVLAVFVLLNDLLTLPVEAYETFRLEAKFGFNRTTPAVFWADFAKGLAVSAVLGLPCAFAVLWLIRVAPGWWWLPVALFLIAFQLLVLFLYPRFIAPLFNRFTPLPDGELKQQLQELARRCQFPVEGIFVMDGSRRSAHSNAYFTGLGRHRRLVLYDTLVNQLAPAELTAVLAHEIGHFRRRHILQLLLVMTVLVLAGTFAASRVLAWPTFLHAFGLPAASPAAGLIALSLMAPPFVFWLAPLLHALQRRFEYQADAYARHAIGSPEPMAAALVSLFASNLENLTPHPWYSMYHYSHPTLVERLAALRE